MCERYRHTWVVAFDYNAGTARLPAVVQHVAWVCFALAPRCPPFTVTMAVYTLSCASLIEMETFKLINKTTLILISIHLFTLLGVLNPHQLCLNTTQMNQSM